VPADKPATQSVEEAAKLKLNVALEEFRTLMAEKVALENKAAPLSIYGTLVGAGVALVGTSIAGTAGAGVIGKITEEHFTVLMLLLSCSFFFLSLLILGYLFSIITIADYQYGELAEGIRSILRIVSDEMGTRDVRVNATAEPKGDPNSHLATISVLAYERHLQAARQKSFLLMALTQAGEVGLPFSMGVVAVIVGNAVSPLLSIWTISPYHSALIMADALLAAAAILAAALTAQRLFLLR
jgi:hypothetical protein